LDKNFYNKGEQAEISFFYVGPADNFPGSRLGEGASIEKIVAHLKIKNGEGQLCGPEINPELNQEEVDNKFKYQIDQVCAHPTVGVILKDGISGEVLAESNFSFTSPEEFVKKATAVETETTDEKDSAVILVLIILGGLIVFLVGVFLLIKKRNKLVLKVLLLLFFSGFCFSNEAKADSVWVRNVFWGGSDFDFLFNYSLNKKTYSPRENVTANAWMSNLACYNVMNVNIVNAGVIWITLPPHSSSDKREVRGKSSLTYTKAAPATSGTYYASFHCDDWYYNAIDKIINFTVTAPNHSCTGGARPANTSVHSGDNTGLTADTSWAYSATNTSRKCQYYCISGYTWNGSLCRLNAICGTANGASYCEEPTEDLCGNGSSLGITKDGDNWTWTCSSVSGTTQDDVSCSATIQTTDCGSPGNWREVNP